MLAAPLCSLLNLPLSQDGPREEEEEEGAPGMRGGESGGTSSIVDVLALCQGESLGGILTLFLSI